MFSQASQTPALTPKLYHICLEKTTANIPKIRTTNHIAVRISYKNPLLKLCRRENRYEQNVNFCRNPYQKPKIIGCILEGYFHKTAAQTALKLRRAGIE